MIRRKPRSRVGLRAMATLIAVIAALLMAPGAAADQRPATAPVTTSNAVAENDADADKAAASKRARTMGQRVEVESQRTQRTQLYANPDGTFTAEMHARPVRVRRADGGWSPVDLTLERKANGVIAPKASPTRMRLSGGGDGPLATLFRHGKSLSLAWQDTLPEPTLDDDTATYPDVLPDVDLVVRAYDDGFAETLVVKTPRAARNPALAKLRFGVETHGVQLRGNGRSFAAVDTEDREVFGSGTPTMWDSSGTFDGRVNAAEDRTDRVAGPATGARRTTMPMRLTGGRLELSPDRALLTGADTEFPVYIDPSVTVDLSYWTMINQRFRHQSYWSYDRSDGVKVGYVEDWSAGWVKYRSLFRFPTSEFRGTHVLSAEFSATVYHSYYCTNTRTDLYRITSGFSSSTTWDNSVPWSSGNYLAKDSGHSCSGTGDRRMEWSTSALASAADNASGKYLILGLRNYNESDINNSWKKFRAKSPKLSVTYNTPPEAPRDITVNGHACAQGADRPTVGSASPKITANLYDADSADRLDVRMYYTPLGGTNSTTNSVLRTDQANGATMTIPEGTIPGGALANGGTYFVQGYARDTSTARDRSPDSARCEFTVDTSRPENMPTVSSTDYPDDGAYHKGVGQTGEFTFGPNGVAGVVAYEFWLDGQPKRTAAPGADGTVTVKVTPHARGINTLYVRSKDPAGNFSDTRSDYKFNVGRASLPVAHWTMSEDTGPVLVDDSGNNHHATLAGGTERSSGRVGTGKDKAIRFDGATGEAATLAPVVDTAASFAVATWVRLTDDTANRTAVSTVGPASSAFRLRYDNARNRWAFVTTDGRDATPKVAASAAAPRLGVWTHLAGTYDEATGELRLYVNGKLEGTATNTYPWRASEYTAIGRARTAREPSEFFAGDVDDVRVWSRMAYPDEMTAIADKATLVGEWLFEEASDDPAAADSSGYGHTATLTGTMTRGDGKDGGGALHGARGGYAKTDGPVLLTDQSLTVSAWARLTDTANWRTAVAQAGEHCSAFLLQYDYWSRKWAFSAGKTDTDGATPVRALSDAPASDQWTHLVGVYDAADRELRIYVNGQREGTISHTAWHAFGALQIGVSLWDTNRGDHFVGGIDDVRVFTGVLSDAAIQNLYDL
ncbi:MAG: hypothetical protein GEU97_11110 [Actinophytocola sp.]|nr:hypothetical protein [Actinophytocola sp.]